MNRLIVFDFNRTLFDPESGRLMPGAPKLLAAAQSKGYVLVLLSQAADGRRAFIDRLGISGFFAEILLVNRKTEQLLANLETRYQADPARSFVIGDRALREILLGYRRGWRTIWLRSGRFADESPHPGQNPEHTVSQLSEIPPLM